MAASLMKACTGWTGGTSSWIMPGAVPDNATIGSGEISLSRHYVRHAEEAHIRDTILHEIAHALVGPRHGHDAVWRRKAREIGCTANRCHTLNFASEPWIMRCPNGCFETGRHRRKAGLVCATCRTPVEFVRQEPVGD